MSPSAMDVLPSTTHSNGFSGLDALKATAKQTLLNGTTHKTDADLKAPGTLLSAFIDTQKRLQALKYVCAPFFASADVGYDVSALTLS